MSDFLDKEYEVPQSGGFYMKLREGENRFRFLDKPIIGNEYWVDKKPVRKRMGEKVTIGEIGDSDLKHFWAMPVFNYTEKRVQVLELTQKSILKTITSLAKDKDWGSPLGYDIVIIRNGEGLDTEYGVQPKPAKPIDEDVKKAWLELLSTNFDIEQLFDGGDPFNPVIKEQPSEDEINIEDIPF